MLFIWLARPIYFSAAFGGSWLWPLLGIIFAPFATLMFILVWTPGGLAGFDWFWIALAALLDIAYWATIGFANRERISGSAR
jgi:hypothetical protein